MVSGDFGEWGRKRCLQTGRTLALWLVWRW